MNDYSLYTGSGKIHKTTKVNIIECASVDQKHIDNLAQKEILRKVAELARTMSEADAKVVNEAQVWNVPLPSLVSESLLTVDNKTLAVETSARVDASDKFSKEEKEAYKKLMEKFAQ